MNTRTRKVLLGGMLAGAMSVGLTAPVFASGGTEPAPKCNSGRGNNSESTPDNDCDPGNSGGHNNGGD